MNKYKVEYKWPQTLSLYPNVVHTVYIEADTAEEALKAALIQFPYSIVTAVTLML